MTKQVLKKLFFIVLFIVVLLVANLTFVGAQEGTDSITPNVEVVVLTPTPSNQPLPTNELDSVTDKEMLAAYKEVLETTKWIATFFLSVATISGVGAFFVVRKSLKDVSKVETSINNYSNDIEALRITQNNITEANNVLQKALTNQRAESVQLRAELASLKKQMRSAVRDFDRRIPRLETLADVDTYTMHLFGKNKTSRKNALRKLIQYSFDNDPVVRRECIRSFGAMPDHPKCFTDPSNPRVLGRLKEMAEKDKERGVRIEAEQALKKFKSIRDE